MLLGDWLSKRDHAWEVGLSFLPAALGRRTPTRIPYSPAFEMCAWPPGLHLSWSGYKYNSGTKEPCLPTT